MVQALKEKVQVAKQISNGDLSVDVNSKEISIDVNRPTKSPIKEQKKSEVISVRISAEGQIFVQDRLITIDAVRANVESYLSLKPQASVVVVSDREADAGFLVRVIDQSRLAGARNVSLAAKK